MRFTPEARSVSGAVFSGAFYSHNFSYHVRIGVRRRAPTNNKLWYELFFANSLDNNRYPMPTTTHYPLLIYPSPHPDVWEFHKSRNHEPSEFLEKLLGLP